MLVITYFIEGMLTPKSTNLDLSAGGICSGLRDIRPIAPPPSGSTSYINYNGEISVCITKIAETY